MTNVNYKSNSNRSIKNASVAILIITGIVLFVGGILYLREYRIGQTFSDYKVSFKTVGTLSLGDPVRVSGVKIGKVTSIDLRYKNVLVNLHVDNRYKIPDDSQFYIRSMGIMGERMVTITLGESEGNLLESSEYVGVYEPGIGEALGSVGHLLVKVDTMLTYVKEIVDSTIGKKEFPNKFTKIVDDVSEASDNINRLIKENKASINRSIVKIEKITNDGDKLVGKIDEVVENVSNDIDTLTTDGKIITNDLKVVSQKVKSITMKIDSGKGLIGRAINDESLSMDVEKLIENVDSLSNKINKKGIKVRFFGD